MSCKPANLAPDPSRDHRDRANVLVECLLRMPAGRTKTVCGLDKDYDIVRSGMTKSQNLPNVVDVLADLPAVEINLHTEI